ncbi:hypothetical protein EV401DRAFT_1301832 [Pisolithus croceorrhizus]|nr:hypothetical protein EV401DRAFT_1301832 [Pisolithus croceorrhizus]
MQAPNTCTYSRAYPPWIIHTWMIMFFFSRQTAQVGSYIDYDRQANIRSMVQEIAVLQAKLCATKDDDEQRALEEDLTGMVLWLCWCGICQEVEQLLPETVNFICKEGMTDGLKDIGSIIRGIRTYPDDNQAHLQRIMIDAGAGVFVIWLFAVSKPTDVEDRVTSLAPL